MHNDCRDASSGSSHKRRTIEKYYQAWLERRAGRDDVGVVVQQQAIIDISLASYGVAGVSGPDDAGHGAVVAKGPEAEWLRDGRVTVQGTDAMQMIELTCPGLRFVQPGSISGLTY